MMRGVFCVGFLEKKRDYKRLDFRRGGALLFIIYVFYIKNYLNILTRKYLYFRARAKFTKYSLYSTYRSLLLFRALIFQDL
jgi:hypothetical protein